MIKKMGRKKIGEILIEEGYLDKKALESALDVQKREGGLIGAILVRMQVITEEELVCALSKQLGLPYIQLSRYNVNRSALHLISRKMAEQYEFFPFEQDAHEISIAMADPLNGEALEKINKEIPLRVQVFLGTPTEIRNAIHQYYGQISAQKVQT